MNKPFVTLAKYFFQTTLAFPASLTVWILISFIEPVIMIFLWNSILKSGGHLPYSYSQIVTYYLLSTLYYRIMQVWSLDSISREIYRGTFAMWLIRPLSYLTIDLAKTIGLKITRIITIIPVLIIFIFIFRNDFRVNLNAVQFIALLLSFVMGFFLYFSFENLLSLVAFWFERTIYFTVIYYVFVDFLSGGTVPLNFLPAIFRSIVNLLPFRYLLSFPLEITLGVLSPFQIIVGFVCGFSWIGIFLMLYKYFYPKGLKRYSPSDLFR